MTQHQLPLAEWLARLVQIPSVSPAYAGSRAGEVGEARFAAQVAQWFSEIGGDVHVDEAIPNRPNVFGIWRGRTQRWVAVDVHTTPPCRIWAKTLLLPAQRLWLLLRLSRRGCKFPAHRHTFWANHN